MEEVNSRSLRTLQGAEAFADAWIVHDAGLCAKRQKPRPSFDLSRQFPATLVFSAGPNAGCPQTPNGSTTRTLNERASNDFGFFRECLKETLRTGFDAMVTAECTVALVARVSCGIYAGRHRERIGKEFVALVDEVLAERVRPGDFFLRVVIPDLAV